MSEYDNLEIVDVRIKFFFYLTNADRSKFILDELNKISLKYVI